MNKLQLMMILVSHNVYKLKFCSILCCMCIIKRRCRRNMNKETRRGHTR